MSETHCAAAPCSAEAVAATAAMRKKLALVLLEPACSSWQSDFPRTHALPWPVASWANPWSALLMFTDAWMRLAWGLAPWFRMPPSGDESPQANTLS